MPNHVENTLTIKNLTSEQVQRIVKACETEKLCNEFMPEPDYSTTPVADTFPEIKARYAKTEEERAVAIANEPTISEKNWYDWRLQNWGTKWGAYEVTFTAEDHSIEINFNSAWSPPSDGWVEAVIEQMPNAELVLTYIEPGCDFFGVTRADRDGVLDETGVLSHLMHTWMAATQTPETVAIYNDEDHERHGEIEDEVLEAWWEAQADVVANAVQFMANGG